MKLNQSWNYTKTNTVYVEEELVDNEYVKKILKKLNNPKIIKIKHYKDIFNRKNQSIPFQKDNQKLILAKNKDKIIYEGSRVCNDFGYENFYYVVNSMNCPYDCEYCFLKGMYPSSYILVYVNYEEVMKKVEGKLKEKSYLSISYEGDLLALEKIHGLNEKWINFAKNNKNITIESRTKSGNFNLLKIHEPTENFIISWSLSPQTIIDNYEKYTPDLNIRINNINNAVKNGWNVRIFIEPVLRINNGVKIYKEFFLDIKEEINISKNNINMDFFRINSDYYKKIKNIYKKSELFAYPFENNNGMMEYKKSYKDMINREFHKIFR